MAGGAGGRQQCQGRCLRGGQQQVERRAQSGQWPCEVMQCVAVGGVRCSAAWWWRQCGRCRTSGRGGCWPFSRAPTRIFSAFQQGPSSPPPGAWSGSPSRRGGARRRLLRLGGGVRTLVGVSDGPLPFGNSLPGGCAPARDRRAEQWFGRWLWSLAVSACGLRHLLGGHGLEHFYAWVKLREQVIRNIIIP